MCRFGTKKTLTAWIIATLENYSTGLTLSVLAKMLIARQEVGMEPMDNEAQAQEYLRAELNALFVREEVSFVWIPKKPVIWLLQKNVASLKKLPPHTVVGPKLSRLQNGEVDWPTTLLTILDSRGPLGVTKDDLAAVMWPFVSPAFVS